MSFHEYPYTNFHEMNLDWVVNKVKELAAAWARVQQDWTDEQAAFANLQSWIENYFNNLDVQTEINVKLDAMVAAGTMSELIAPYVASGLPAEVAEQIGDVVAAQIGPVVAAQIGAVVADQLPAVAAAAAAQEVSAWLALHVNPETGYVIDDTFTVQGAAADAKAVGDEFTAIKSALSEVGCARATVDVTSGTTLDPNTVHIPFALKSGDKFTIYFDSNANVSEISSVYGYANDTLVAVFRRKTDLGVEYFLETSVDCDGISFTIDGTHIGANTSVAVTLKQKIAYDVADIKTNVIPSINNDIDDTNNALDVVKSDLGYYVKTVNAYASSGVSVNSTKTHCPLKNGDTFTIYFEPNANVSQINSYYGYVGDSLYTLGWFNALGKKATVTVTRDYDGIAFIVNADKVSADTTVTMKVEKTIALRVTDLENKVDALQIDAESLDPDARFVIPSYYFTDSYLDNKVARINDVATNGFGDTFVFISDEHWEYNERHSPALIRYINKHANLSKLISGGDHCQIICAYENSQVQRKINPLEKDFTYMIDRAFDGEKYSIIGNHEYLTYPYNTEGYFDGYDFKKWNDNAFYIRPTNMVYGDNKLHYFYVDVPSKKIRYAFLSVYDYGETQSGTKYRMAASFDIPQEEVTWVSNVVLNLESGWSVLFFAHSFASMRFDNPHVDPPVVSWSSDAKALGKVLLEYDGNAEIIGVVCGHTHRDGEVVISDSAIETNTGNALLEIITTCDACNMDEVGPEEALLHRDAGTIYEQAFDVINLDLDNKCIKAIRIGGLADNLLMPYGDLEERHIYYSKKDVSVNGTITITPKIGGTITYSSENNSVATFVNGTVTGVSQGCCRVFANNDSGQSEIYLIVVG